MKSGFGSASAALFRIAAEAVAEFRIAPDAEIALVAQGDAVYQYGVAGFDVPAAVGAVEGAAVDPGDAAGVRLGAEAVRIPVFVSGIVIGVAGDAVFKPDIRVDRPFDAARAETHLEFFRGELSAAGVGDDAADNGLRDSALQPHAALGEARHGAVFDPDSGSAVQVNAVPDAGEVAVADHEAAVVAEPHHAFPVIRDLEAVDFDVGGSFAKLNEVASFGRLLLFPVCREARIAVCAFPADQFFDLPLASAVAGGDDQTLTGIDAGGYENRSARRGQLPCRGDGGAGVFGIGAGPGAGASRTDINDFRQFGGSGRQNAGQYGGEQKTEQHFHQKAYPFAAALAPQNEVSRLDGMA